MFIRLVLLSLFAIAFYYHRRAAPMLAILLLGVAASVTALRVIRYSSSYAIPHAAANLFPGECCGHRYYQPVYYIHQDRLEQDYWASTRRSVDDPTASSPFSTATAAYSLIEARDNTAEPTVKLPPGWQDWTVTEKDPRRITSRMPYAATDSTKFTYRPEVKLPPGWQQWTTTERSVPRTTGRTPDWPKTTRRPYYELKPFISVTEANDPISTTPDMIARAKNCRKRYDRFHLTGCTYVEENRPLRLTVGAITAGVLIVNSVSGLTAVLMIVLLTIPAIGCVIEMLIAMVEWSKVACDRKAAAQRRKQVQKQNDRRPIVVVVNAADIQNV